MTERVKCAAILAMVSSRHRFWLMADFVALSTKLGGRSIALKSTMRCIIRFVRILSRFLGNISISWD